MRGDHEASEANIERALKIHTDLGNPAGIADLHNAMGILEEERGRYRKALEAYRRALRIREDLGDEHFLAESLSNVGYTHHLLGESDSAVLFLERALGMFRGNEDAYGILVTLQSIGFCQEALGKWIDASRTFLEALELARELDIPTATAVSRGNLGLLAQHEGRYKAAFEAFGEARRTLAEVGDVLGQVEFLLREADAYLDLGALQEASAALDETSRLQGEGANREDRATLLRLRGRWHLLRGETGAAAAALSQAVQEAEASKSAATAVAARIDSGRQALVVGQVKRGRRALESAAQEAEDLGHTGLELISKEALARALLADGAAEDAEETARKALRLAERRDANGYAGTYRIRLLLATILTARGRDAAADRARRDAGDDLGRLRAEVPDELLPAFDQLPGVQALSGHG